MKSLCVWMQTLVFASAYCLARNANADEPLVVERIECRGNVITSCDFIRDRLYLKHDARVDEEEIGNAKLRLSSLTRFTSVDIRLEKGPEKGRVIVVVEVTEADPITKESAIGLSARYLGVRQSVAGRITNENLFGTGKVLSLTASESSWITGMGGQGHGARLLYADPRLFDSKKYFLIGGLSYSKNYFDDTNLPWGGKRVEDEHIGVDLAIGRRLFDFSYITLGYAFRPASTYSERTLQGDGSYEVDTTTPGGSLLVNYGWNSEDDPYFPTRGSRFNIIAGWTAKSNSLGLGLGLRKTWKSDSNTFWTLRLGAAPGTEYQATLEESLPSGFSYARTISPRHGFGGIRRGRWYLESTFGPSGITSNGTHLTEIGVKAGVRLETKVFGLIDLYLIGSHLG